MFFDRITSGILIPLLAIDIVRVKSEANDLFNPIGVPLRIMVSNL